jgi:hypothetical protein
MGSKDLEDDGHELHTGVRCHSSRGKLLSCVSREVFEVAHECPTRMSSNVTAALGTLIG